MTGEAQVTEGVFQGDTPSGDLFLAFIADIDKYFENMQYQVQLTHEYGIDMTRFADDYVMYANNQKELQKKLERLNEYCNENDLTLNVKKTKIIIFHKGNINLNKYKFTYLGEEIEILNQFLYLGVLFSSSVSYNKHYRVKLTNSNCLDCGTNK